MATRTLTLEQKAALTSGSDFWHTEAVPDAGIPRIMVSDGPHGLRKQPEDGDPFDIGGSVPATCFPPAVALACTWNVELARAEGEALGEEARAEKISVILGPGVNIRRSPLCGRNFEYFSEDPFLAGELGAAWVEGVQSQGVGTSLKHLAANNQETDRLRVSARVDDRTLREIYLPAFERIVKGARPLTVMCSYNKINGVYSSENPWLLTELLRDEWGYDGLVVSDWGAVNDRVAAVSAGLDLTMPVPGNDDVLVDAVSSGVLDESVLDVAVERLTTLIERTRDAVADDVSYDVDAHHALAKSVALEAAVLLKNDGILPLDPGAGTVGLIGEFARTPLFQGQGSSQVVATRVDSALDAVTALIGDRARFAPGFEIEGGEDAALLAEAVEVARAVDVAVVFLGLPASYDSEGADRTHIFLPPSQLAVLDAVVAASPNVVVVLSNGSVVSVSDWQDGVRAVLEGWLLGQAGGAATADLLFGVANPSGKLTETIPLRLEDTPCHLNFPGSDGEVEYGERVYVGYRYHDTVGAPVAYPFGHGLSYTTFEYSDLSVAPAGDGFAATFTVTNTGTRAGSETAQVYVRDVESSVDRPAHELKGFAKVALEPGASQTVTVELDGRALAFWSLREQRWLVEAGEFELQVGASSRDIRLAATVVSPGDGIPMTLTGLSLVSEWLAHPAGGPILRAALQQAIGTSELPFDPESVIGRMALGSPLLKFVNFIPGMDSRTVAQLVAAASPAPR